MADWNKIKHRGKVTDRRSQRSGRSLFGCGSPFGRSSSGSGQQLPINLSQMSGRSIVIMFLIFIAFSFFTSGGSGLTDLTSQIDDTGIGADTSVESGDFAGEDEYEVFVSTVLGSNNALWEDIFARNDLRYREPELILFRNFTNSACGGASSAIGPHYCPADETIYIDERFFDDVLTRLGAEGGDVAEAYIVGHEVAHHAQNLLGLTDRLNQARISNASNVNELSVELELQADCFSGLWAHSIKDLGVFGPDEISEALDAAAAVGDDRVQETSSGRVDPESWTHGSSEQREQWFNTGFVTGDFDQCRI